MDWSLSISIISRTWRVGAGIILITSLLCLPICSIILAICCKVVRVCRSSTKERLLSLSSNFSVSCPKKAQISFLLTSRATFSMKILASVSLTTSIPTVWSQSLMDLFVPMKQFCWFPSLTNPSSAKSTTRKSQTLQLEICIATPIDSAVFTSITFKLSHSRWNLLLGPLLIFWAGLPCVTLIWGKSSSGDRGTIPSLSLLERRNYWRCLLSTWGLLS